MLNMLFTVENTLAELHKKHLSKSHKFIPVKKCRSKYTSRLTRSDFGQIKFSRGSTHKRVWTFQEQKIIDDLRVAGNKPINLPCRPSRQSSENINTYLSSRSDFRIQRMKTVEPAIGTYYVRFIKLQNKSKKARVKTKK